MRQACPGGGPGKASPGDPEEQMAAGGENECPGTQGQRGGSPTRPRSENIGASVTNTGAWGRAVGRGKGSSVLVTLAES